MIHLSLPVTEETRSHCTDKASAPQIKCWECMNYDNDGNFYDQCPMHGTVDPVRAYMGNCTGKCFTHTDDRNADCKYNNNSSGHLERLTITCPKRLHVLSMYIF